MTDKNAEKEIQREAGRVKAEATENETEQPKGRVRGEVNLDDYRPWTKKQKRVFLGIALAGIIGLMVYAMIPEATPWRPTGWVPKEGRPASMPKLPEQQAPQEMTQKKVLMETVAFTLNTQGKLCAKVLTVIPQEQPGVYKIVCQEYRSDPTSTVTHILRVGS